MTTEIKGECLVMGYLQDFNYHNVKDKDGDTHHIDLFVNADFHEQTDGMTDEQYYEFCKSLVGKTVFIEGSHPYVSIAVGVKIIS